MRMVYFGKRRLLLCLLPVIFLLGMYGAYATVSVKLLAGKIILVDAGHGGIDPGGNRPGIKEKDINLAVALKLKEVLNGYGAKVVLSREIDGDLSPQCDNEKIIGRYRRDLAARMEMVEESDADLFISIHANTNHNPRRRGAETFYYRKSETGKNLAEAIQDALSKIAPGAGQAAPGDFFILRRNTIPAVLVEVGYITNPEESQLLQSDQHQQKLAEAIAQGICSYHQSSLLLQ